jgi:hypothetical protein
MEEIALNPFRNNDAEIQAVASLFCSDSQTKMEKMEKAKREPKSRKHQSKLWSIEMQDKIREEWAAKRLAAESFNPLCEKHWLIDPRVYNFMFYRKLIMTLSTLRRRRTL